jgi:hypothetical protein
LVDGSCGGLDWTYFCDLVELKRTPRNLAGERVVRPLRTRLVCMVIVYYVSSVRVVALRSPDLFSRGGEEQLWSNDVKGLILFVTLNIHVGLLYSRQGNTFESKVELDLLGKV